MKENQQVEKMKELFRQVQDLEELKEAYAKEKQIIKETYAQITKLQEKKNRIDLNEHRARIGELERQYEEIFHKIDLHNINEGRCETVEHLERIFECTSDTEVHRRRCIELIQNITAVEIINDGGDGKEALRISHIIERVLELAHIKGLLTDVSKVFSNIVKVQIEESLPEQISCYLDRQKNLLICQKDGSGREELRKYKSIDLQELRKCMPRSGLIILTLLKENMAEALITEDLPANIIERNNEWLKGSEAFIKNIDDWILSVIIKRSVNISKGTDAETAEIDTVFIGERRVFVSEKYGRLKRCQKLFGEVSSGKKEKAGCMLREAVLRFLRERRANEKRELFMAYSDVTEQQRIEYGVVDKELLFELRETLFMNIIKRSSALNLRVEDSSLVKKAKLKEVYMDFIENTNAFITEKTKGFFISQFFGNLYGNFVSFILHPRKYNSDELSELCDVSRYALGLSFEHRDEPMENYDKLSNVITIMSSPIKHVVELYRNKQIDLDKAELRTAIRMFYESSEERDSFLETIY